MGACGEEKLFWRIKNVNEMSRITKIKAIYQFKMNFWLGINKKRVLVVQTNNNLEYFLQFFQVILVKQLFIVKLFKLKW